MFKKKIITSSLATLGFFLMLNTSSALAQKELVVEIPVSAVTQTKQFQKIEQPLALKLVVALAGLGLMSAELWWFIFSQSNKY